MGRSREGGYILFLLCFCLFPFGFGVLFGVLSAWCSVMFVFCIFLFVFFLYIFLSDCLRPPTMVSKLKQDSFI